MMKNLVRLPQQDEDNCHKVTCVPTPEKSRSGFSRSFAAGKTRRSGGGTILPIVVLSGMVFACAARAADTATATGTRQDVIQNVVMLLRDGNVEQALKGLEAVSDVATSNGLAGEEGYSSAGAALHRALAQLSSEAQFSLLSQWSIPAESPPKIRVLTVLVPTLAPPMEFARALGERPRSTSFPVSSIGEVQGIFSSAWSLVVAARDSGRLKRLVTDVGQLVDKKVPNAELILALAQIVDDKADKSNVVQVLSQRAIRLKIAPATKGARPAVTDPDDLVLACAALQHPTLRPLGEEMLALLLNSNQGTSAPIIRPFLRMAHATAMLTNHESQSEIRTVSKLAPRLKYWVPVAGTPEESTSPPMRDAVWLVQEDHILHLAGSGHDTLQFRYPLLGHFRFDCETIARIDTDGGLTYGGRGYHVVASKSEFRITDPVNNVIGQQFCPFIRQPSTTSPNRLTITSTPDTSIMAVNLHPMWKDSNKFQTSPWLGLKSQGEFSPLFRNLKLTGQPVIPRAVPLTEGNVLRGWRSQVFGERPDKKASLDSGWSLDEGVLQVPKPASKSPTNHLEELFSYQRPLLEGETIHYEFFYEPGVCEVSPALGRVAFLFRPDGIRIHWVTDGDRDWTGLTPDNAVTEPLNRRGPRPLPFRMNDWNRVSVARTATGVTLSLNDVAVYQRPVDWVGDYRFGLYRPQRTTGAQVRNIILTGDWPESLPQDFLDNPATTAGQSLSIADRHAMNRLFEEPVLARNIFAVRRHAMTLPVAERFEFLSRWVLPGADHPGFRVTADFTQTQPSPVAFEPGVTEAESGGQIVSPVFEWLDAARELGRLAECRKSLEQVVASDQEFQHRARAALLMLLCLEQGDATAVTSNFEKLLKLLQSQTPLGIEDQWPETLVAVRGARNFPNNPAVAELIKFLYLQRTFQSRPEGIDLWHSHITALFGQLELLKPVPEGGNQPRRVELQDWIRVNAAASSSRGQGFPKPIWSRQDSAVIKRSGHHEDYLFYRPPLSGNYEVECEILQPTEQTSLIMIDGRCLGIQKDLKNLAISTFGSPVRVQPMDVPLTYIGPAIRYRGVVRHGICTVYLNGREVQSEVQRLPVDPWIAIRSSGRDLNRVRDLRISGRPTVLDAVPLSESRDLVGWIEYHQEPIAGKQRLWKHVDDPESGGWIVGHTTPNLADTFAESLLRYQRPLVEDGTIEYEFFYEPRQVEAHPALDRLALVLQPSGIREHWITDGRYDRSELAPDNMAELPHCRRGPAELPLKTGDWNQLKLILRESTAQVELNGTLVYERELEAGNERTFGLFHYADVTEARVRNVVMRGEWPTTVPSLSEQQLAATTTEPLDAERSRFKAVFRHDFQKNGFPEKYFKVPLTLPGSSWKVTPEGVEVNSTGTGQWTYSQISPRFTLSGDFDIEAQFDHLKMECSQRSTSIQLNITFDEPLRPDYGLNRTLAIPHLNLLYSSRHIVMNGGERAWIAKDDACESLSGRFRLARRGKTAYFLFADRDSENFQLLETQPAPEVDIERDGVRLFSLSQSVGVVNVVWKTLTLRADRMAWHPESSMIPGEAVYVMQADGKGLRLAISPEKAGFTSVSFPEWSSDGRQLAVEMSAGSRATSHVVVLSADGSEFKDLGPGCMPSFSRDGQNLVCSQPRLGIVMMKSDGTSRRVIDAKGWGAQWSPDGNMIAYGKAGNIMLFDVQTRKSRQLLTGDASTRYSYIYGNPGWSHDSRSIAFKARCRELIQDELVVAELDSAEGFHVLHSDARAIVPDVTFSPDNRQVIFGLEDPETPGLALHAISCGRPDECLLLPGQPSGLKVTGCAWSHDGKSIAFTGSIPSVEWISEN